MIQLPPELWSIILHHKRKQHFNQISKYLEPLIKINVMDQNLVGDWEHVSNMDMRNLVTVIKGFDEDENLRYFIYYNIRNLPIMIHFYY